MIRNYINQKLTHSYVIFNLSFTKVDYIWESRPPKVRA